MTKSSGAKAPLLEARRLNTLSAEAARSLANKGFVAYAVIHEDGARKDDARRERRARTRLRSAKVIDGKNAFLCEAIVHDRSSEGMRLILARNVGLPARFGVYEDESGDMITAALAWRRGQTIGLSITRPGPPAPMTLAQSKALGGRYYNVRD